MRTMPKCSLLPSHLPLAAAHEAAVPEASPAVVPGWPLFPLPTVLVPLPPSVEQLRKKRLYLKQRAEEARADASEGSVPIYAPDPALAPSFDPEVTGYRYKVLEDPTGIIAR